MDVKIVFFRRLRQYFPHLQRCFSEYKDERWRLHFRVNGDGSEFVPRPDD